MTRRIEQNQDFALLITAVVLFVVSALHVASQHWQGQRINSVIEQEVATQVQAQFSALGQRSERAKTQAPAASKPPAKPEPSPAQPDTRGQTLAVEVQRAYGVPAERVERLAGAIVTAAEKHDIPAELFASLVMTESSFRSRVRSHAGAIGPAQVMPEYWSDGLCQDLDLDEAADNILCGARILAHYREGCDGDWRCALHRYNVGPGALRRGEPGALKAAERYEQRIRHRLDQLAGSEWL